MFRRILFWLHLIAGLLAGLLIGVKCLTGIPLAFDKELLNWAEAEQRFVSVPTDTKPLELASLVSAARAQRENKSPSGIVLSAEPTAALAVQFGREDTVYVNPYTGEAKSPSSSKMRNALRFMEDLHRFFALSGEARDWGKSIGGASNILFVFLALSGLVIWWPRHLSWRSLKAVMRFNLGLKGKARDWNWHTTLGFWATPALLVLTVTAIPLSYRWANSALFTLVGDQAPQQGQGGQNRGFPTPPAPEGAKRLSHVQLLEIAAKASPNFEQLTLRQEGPGQGRRGPGGLGRSDGAEKRMKGNAGPETQPDTAGTGPREEKRPERSRPEGAPANASPEGKVARAPAQAVAIQVKEAKAWPRTATTTLYLNPYTGDILKTERFADQSAGQRLRHWARYLHTGEALGLPGQIAGALACFIGVVLMYTGFALSWRRFFVKRKA